MKYFLGFLLGVSISFGGVYLASAFVVWNFTNIADWTNGERFIYLSFSGIISIFMTAMICVILEE